MRNRPFRLLILSFFIIAPILLLLLNRNTSNVVRGKSSSTPRTGLSQAALQAQDVALADARVLAETAGQRTEVFTVDYLGASYLPAPECDCWQVSIYHYEKNAAVVALVDAATDLVIDVHVVPGMQPGIPPRLQERAIELIHEDEAVAEALGFQPSLEDIAPMHGSLANTECGVPHLCVAASFWLGERIFWAFVDLTTEEVIGTRWGDPGPAFFVDPGETPSIPTGGNCIATPGSVTQDGWIVNYETTPSDGFRVYNVTFNGLPVLTSSKVVEWHADYTGGGFIDATGCSPSGGFAIRPSGDTQLNQLLDGFELVQDFRMLNWGQNCNYRYEQHYRFYNDGSFRVVAGAYGRGCSINDPANYLPLIRIDIAAGADEGNQLFITDGAGWYPQNSEFIECPEFDTACAPGPYPVTEDLNRWFIWGPDNDGFLIEPSQGQFPDGRGDNQYFYATRYNPAEGDADLGASIGNCCIGDYRQGPHNFVNGESIENENIVLWYVPQLLTDLDPESYYCWTVSATPVETYPCFGGPRFTPLFGLDNKTFLPTIRND